MLTPIKNLKKTTNSLTKVKDLIPRGSIIETHLFYDGALEFALAEDERFVIANTNKYVIYEFWTCAMQDPKRIANIAEHMFPILNEQTFDILQKEWAHYKDPFMRSALFFLLNRCSSLGMITHGEFNIQNYNPFAVSALRKFNPENFHIISAHKKKLENCVGKIKSSTHVFIHAGKFSFNFFEHGKTESLEELNFNHDKLLDALPTTGKKSVVVYNYHPRLKMHNKNYNLIYLDSSGRETNESNAKEVILHNV
jgi:site-specific DNA-adenine methylase